MVKVKFTCNWTSDSEIKKRVTNNFITEENYTPNIELTDGEDYDYLIVFNRLNKHSKAPKENIFTFIMEPSWSPNWDRNCFNYSNKVFVHDKILFGGHENIEEVPSFMFYHMDYNLHPIKSLLSNNDFNKKKKISMVVSHTPNSNLNYGLRTKLAMELIDRNFDVDIYGNGWSNIHKNVKGSVKDKYDALIDYQFSIGIENSCEKNYLTEKYFDIPLCNATPIYYGAPNVNDIYENRFKLDLNNIEQSLDTISDILNNNYYEVENVIKNKNLYFTNHNLYNKVKQIINNTND
jgi:hypothetical protein